jgi:hypothetical protein
MEKDITALELLTNANDARRMFWRIVQDALSYIVVQVGTVMIRLYGVTRGLVSISMEGIQMCANPLNRCKVL